MEVCVWDKLQSNNVFGRCQIYKIHNPSNNEDALNNHEIKVKRSN